MTRSFATPEAFRQALEHRLRERASGSGQELARLRQLLVFDRFLARIAATFGDRAVLKGGLVIELRLERARTTKDVDLRLVGHPDKALEKLREAGRSDLGDFLRFEIGEDPRHPEIEAEGMIYEGRRYRARPLLAGKVYGSPFGVDVAFAEPMVGEVEKIEGSRVLRFAGVEPFEFLIYPVESHIAEKLHAYTMPRSRPNSRVKDLPDLALLGMVRPLEEAKLHAAIRTTFGSRGTHELPSKLPSPPIAWAPVYERLARTDDLRWPTIDDLMKAVRAFIDPVLARHGGSWLPAEWRWAQEGRI
ncbi:MAG: nucleotidyl transferase AbiEii/AbiGii toxin family protein [Planctomycetota bacterium]